VVSAHLDRHQINDGETVQLQIEAEGASSGQPDTRPLHKQFEVLSSSTGSRVSINNGQMRASTTWTLALRPKETGHLTIPPLEVNGEKTPALTLEVREAPASGTPGDGPVFVETEVDRDDPYVQGMVVYTVRMYFRVTLKQANLSEPTPDNALVHRLGKERKYSVQRAGNHYQVLERRYAIFPQASGKLRLSGPVLDAKLAQPKPRRQRRGLGGFFDDPFDDPFFSQSPFDDLFADTRPLRVRGKPQVLHVRPRPDAYKYPHWLPAQDLQLSGQWQPQNGDIHVGDPVTLSLGIHAQGLSGEQLPDLAPQVLDGFRVYPDKAKTRTWATDQGVQGEKTRNIVFVPTRAGSFELPPIRLHWWDTRAAKAQLAELPGRQVTVLPAPKSAAPPASAPAGLRTTPSGAMSGPQPAQTQAPSLLPALAGKADIWLWVALLLGLAWLATLLLWRRARTLRRPDRVDSAPPPSTDSAPPTIDGKTERLAFLAACRSNDPQAARSHLLAWAATHWPDRPPRGLDELGRYLDDAETKAALAELDRALFRDEGKAWKGDGLARLLEHLPEDPHEERSDSELPGLYPR